MMSHGHHMRLEEPVMCPTYGEPLTVNSTSLSTVETL